MAKQQDLVLMKILKLRPFGEEAIYTQVAPLGGRLYKSETMLANKYGIPLVSDSIISVCLVLEQS